LAIADFTQAIGIKPDYEAAFYNRGLAYADKAELVEEPERLSLLDLAIADYSEAIEMKHDYAEAMANKGFAFLMKGEAERALYWFGEALKRRERLPDKGKLILEALKVMEEMMEMPREGLEHGSTE